MFEARPTPVGIPTTRLPLFHAARGKVRDVYEVDDDRLLLVATDRVSAFDVVMREAVPYKGIVLTQLTAWWLHQLEAEVPHHMISADAKEIIKEVPELAPHHATIVCMTCRASPRRRCSGSVNMLTTQARCGRGSVG